MAVELIVTQAARDDLDETYTWYESRNIGLGETFLIKVDACIEAICRMPTRHHFIHGTYRRAHVRKFPYSVFYEYEDERVSVYGVLHNSRSPDVWRKRLP